MENKRVPEVRFEGFSGEWEERKLNEVAEIIGGGTPSTAVQEYWDGDIDWYSPVEIGKEIYAVGSQRKITSLGLKKSSAKVLPANKTILFTSRAGIGDMAILKKDGATNQGFQSLVVNNNYNTYFVYSIGHKIKEFALKHASGSTFLEISGRQLGKMVLFVPSLEEQTKIGNFFKQLDDTIALHQQEITTLKQTKQGFLQKMFPKEGESVPEVRFPGFTGEWEQRKFKDFISKAGKKNTMGENYPAYSVSNKVGLVSQSEQFDGSRLDNLDKTSYKLVNPNEFAYNPARINVGSIAFNDLNKTVIVSSLYVILKMSEELDNEFILQFIKSQFFIDEVRKNTEGSVREYLFFENFKNIKFPYTSSKDEQTKIGTFFKQLDDTIALHQRELDALQETKKAFLQKMFV
ncbi:restriction endonuclease subunit S [Bacillus subtilis]|uniref:restriction endonuclease subunit S n=1 Tax=Bacillus subtilis TaxID=1423 RepID=UPI0021F4BE33|nr:restriction endonuclease subunit S [Bacillus subtilis]MEC1430557.1 restriction endonuclease subunit S [Bacillus subtilis]UYP04012.1 restriction endonuclease subunit S [Bacillus subtilis]